MSLNEQLMARALAEAERAAGDTSPNPMVGAVIHKEGRIISTGYHVRAGAAHAEAAALASAGEEARGASLVVTLEPCSHFGRTPPCTEAIIRSGIRDVTVGTLDPNPRESGRGVELLEQAGVRVTVGVLERRCRDLNRVYNHFITTRRPFVQLKLASSLDGRIATSSGHARWVSGPEALEFTHGLRAKADGIMVGARTVLADDPELTCRLAPHGHQPKRVVLDPRGEVGAGHKVVAGAARVPTILFHGPEAGPGPGVEDAGVVCRKVGLAGRGLDLGEVMDILGTMEISSLLVDGGGRLAAGLVAGNLVSEFLFIIAPKLVGGDGIPAMAGLGVQVMGDAVELEYTGFEPLGRDILVRARPVPKVGE